MNNEGNITEEAWGNMSMTQKRLFVGDLEDNDIFDDEHPDWLRREAKELRAQWNAEIRGRWSDTSLPEEGGW